MPMYVGDNGEPFEARFIMDDNAIDIAYWGKAPVRFVKHNMGHYARIDLGGFTVIERAHFERLFKEVV